jgi:hypothetical protein
VDVLLVVLVLFVFGGWLVRRGVRSGRRKKEAKTGESLRGTLAGLHGGQRDDWLWQWGSSLPEDERKVLEMRVAEHLRRIGIAVSEEQAGRFERAFWLWEVERLVKRVGLTRVNAESRVELMKGY